MNKPHALYRQGQICKTLNLKKQRVEYLSLKASILPKVEASGTGTYNLYDFGAIVDLAIADQLMAWGINFRDLRERLDDIRRLAPELYNPTEEVNLLKPEDNWFFIETKALVDGVPYLILSHSDLANTVLARIAINSIGVLIINLTALKFVALGNDLADFRLMSKKQESLLKHRVIRV